MRERHETRARSDQGDHGVQGIGAVQRLGDAHDDAATADVPPLEMLALDAALTELQSVAPRQAQIVELRYFGGLSVPEVAEALRMNPRSVDRDWAAARVWLRRRLRP